MADDELSAALVPLLVEVLDDADIRLTSLARLSGGASRSTWSVGATGRSGEHSLILQRDQGLSTRDWGGMGVEGALLLAAAEAGVPVPPLLAHSGEPVLAGQPFLLAGHVEGETIARRIQRDDRFAAARDVFAADCGRALARVHAMDPTACPGLVAVDQIEQYRTVLDDLGAAHPVFELAFRWLDRHRPSETRTDAVVHGDFRLGNLIVDDDGLAAVIDWELAHLGDPLEDLGWLCVRAWRFGGEPPVGGLGSREALLDAYGAESGRPVTPDELRWWEVLGTLKWGIMCVMQAHSHLSGLRFSMEHAAIGRRARENEYDLLELIG